MKTALIALLALTGPRLAPFVGTNAKSKLFICSTPQNDPLDQTAYEALAYIEVKGVGEMGEIGTQQNILTYDTWADEVVQKGKGMKNAGDPNVETARAPTDPGQIAIRAAAKQPHNYAIKIVRNDPATLGGTGTTIYNRGLVVGPARPQGRNEDFDLEVFTLGFVQEEIVVEPT